MSEVYRVQDIKEKLDIGTRTLCNQPDFPAIRIGGSIRIPKKAFDAWIEEQAQSQMNGEPGKYNY
ncbi:MAG TPA: helix-turn-helix domain-containing protein [bacterium]|nr:helix-turn-helix domain-containing protein [bacterium]